MIYRIFLFMIGSILCTGVLQAQDTRDPNDPDNSGEQTEIREDAYRKQMELEGSRDPKTFSNTSYTSQAKQEKLDKLPQESRDNIRDQLTDVIIENGKWEPFDALRAYPYDPTLAAQEDPGLFKQEQEAWAEQMEKYHKREATAFEASRPSLPGNIQQLDSSSSPDGQTEQSQNGAEAEGGEQGENPGHEGESQGEDGQKDSQDSSSGAAASYQPYQSHENEDTDEISTAGVAESALDFLKAQGKVSGNNNRVRSSDQVTEQQGAFNQASASAEEGASTSQQNMQDSQQQSESEIIIPGTIAIEDLDKLEGMAEPEEDNPDDL